MHCSYCLIIGLWEGDEALQKAFDDACDITTVGKQVRHFFVLLLLHVIPGDALDFYKNNKIKLCQDFQPKDRRGKDLNVEEETKGLLEIQEMLRDAGKSMKDFNLPSPVKLPGVNESSAVPIYIEQELYSEYEQQELLENSTANYIRMNSDQKNIYKAVLDSVGKKKGQMFAIDAPGDFYGCKF